MGSTLAFADDLEQKAQSIDRKLIAPCCWTSTLDQHDSEVSVQMKAEIRSRLSQGQSEDQILKYFEDKYGERVLSEPKTKGFNLMAWLFPFFAFVFGGIILAYVLKTSQAGQKTKPKSPVTSPNDLSEADKKYKKIIDQELYRS